MTLGPTILLPPLYEIQRHIQRIHEKYGENKMRLEVLDDSQEIDVVANGWAPRAVVFSFLSMLSEQLYRYNMLKATIHQEKKLKQRISETFLAIFIIIILVFLGMLIAFVLVPRFKKYTKMAITFAKLETAYYLILSLGISIYLLFLVIMVYKKNKIIYESYYETDALFSNEESIKHLISMMKPETKSMFDIMQRKQFSCKGINPLIGYFLKLNRNFDVKYSFIPDSVNSGARNDAAMRTRRTFNFTDNRQIPYKLTSDSLLDIKNLPASVVFNNEKFVDPFVKDKNYIGDPELLKRKLQKYDIFGQYARIRDAVMYFESFLSSSIDRDSNMDDAVYERLTNTIKSMLIINNIIATNDLHPSSSFLNNLPQDQKVQLINLRDFMMLVMVNSSPFSYYDHKERTGYFLNASHLERCVFRYYTTELEENVCFVRSNPDEVVTINIGVDEKPEDQIENNFERFLGEPHQAPFICAFDANIDLSTGELSPSSLLIRGNTTSIDSDISIYVPRQRNIRTGGVSAPEYKTLFSGIDHYQNLSANGSHSSLRDLKSSMFIYRLRADNYILQNQRTNLESTFRMVRPFLLQSVLNYIGELDKNYESIRIDARLIDQVLRHVDLVLRNNAHLLKGGVQDFLNELPIQINERARLNADNSGSRNSVRRFIPYEMFMLKMRSMDQEEFLNKFLYHLDVLRQTSLGLKKMHELFDTRHKIFAKTFLIKEFSFYMFLLFGIFELIHQYFLLYMKYKCAEIGFIDKEDEIRKQFQINIMDAPTEIATKTRLMQKQLDKLSIRKNKILSNASLIAALLTVGYLLVLVYLHAWKVRSRNFFNYNNYVLEYNGNQIVIDSEQVMSYTTHLITENRQFFHVSSNYKESGDPDEVYQLLKRHAHISKSSKVTLNDSVDLTKIHSRLINIIESFYKCNKLMNTENDQLPFPMLEASVYVLVILVVSLVITYSFFHLKPLQSFENLKKWLKIKELMRQDIEIDPRSFGFPCDEPPQKKKSVRNALTYIFALVLLIIGILFTAVLFLNTNSFASSLYNSPMFRETQCYGKH